MNNGGAFSAAVAATIGWLSGCVQASDTPRTRADAGHRSFRRCLDNLLPASRGAKMTAFQLDRIALVHSSGECKGEAGCR